MFLSDIYRNFIKPLALDAGRYVLDILFPIICIFCESEGEFICADCAARLERAEAQYCMICQKPAIAGLTHPGCRHPFGVDRLVCILNYHHEPVRQAIIGGKYRNLPGIFTALGQMAARHLIIHPPLVDKSFILVPLPLHPRKQRKRGFNQTEIICQSISKELGLPVVHALSRKKFTKPQKDLKRAQRILNVQDAFTAAHGVAPLWRRLLFNQPHRPVSPNLIKSNNIILVDDVTTTGSTLTAAAKVLKRNGAKQVWCLAIAKD